MKYYYSSNPPGFYSDDLPRVIEDNGFTIDELTEISKEDYELFFNPPEGKYGEWVDGKPVVIDLPPIDYFAIAQREYNRLKSEVQNTTYTLNLKLMAGRKLTTKETITLNEWLDYSDLLDELDLSTAPNIEWPTKPN
jgi:hypothetical protein